MLVLSNTKKRPYLWLSLSVVAFLTLLTSLWMWPTAVLADEPSFIVNQVFGSHNSGTVSIATGDMDGDGDLDIVAGNISCDDDGCENGGQNLVYLNDGAGNFYTGPVEKCDELPNDIRCFGTDHDFTVSVAVGDINSDGALDIVVGNLGEQNVVYLNDGHGNFDSAVNFGTGSDRSWSVAVGDMNSNGKLDIVVGNQSEPNAIYWNDGIGNFPLNSTFPISDSTKSVAVGDLDNNNHLDIIVGNNHGQPNLVYLNDTSGNFTQPITFGTGADPTESVAVGDMDGDTDLDIIVGNDRAQNAVYLNDGTGRRFSISRPFGTNNDQTSIVTVGDINGNGTLDIVVGNTSESGEQNVVYLNAGNAFFYLSRHFGSSVDHTNALALADINHNGTLDIITGNINESNAIYVNDGASELDSHGVLYQFGHPTGETRSVIVGDFNGDGTLDRLSVNSEHGFFRTIAAGDLDNDDDLDIVMAKIAYNSDSNTYDIGAQNIILLNDGAGNFTDTLFGPEDESASVAVGDMNKDGHLDIIIGNKHESNRVYLNDGLGNFDWEGGVHLFGTGSDETTSLAVGDMNGDGALDIVTVDFFEQNVLYLNDGTGDFSTARNFGTSGERTISIAVGDMNGDGALDIVLGNKHEQNVVYFNDGDGNFYNGIVNCTNPPDNARCFGTGTNEPRSIAVGDMNGDGSIDIIVGNYNGPNSIYLNDGRGTFSTTRIFGSGSDKTWSVAVGDMNEDGLLDILMGNVDELNLTHFNKARISDKLANNPPYLTVERPLSTAKANFYSSPVIRESSIISIPYTLYDPEGDPVRFIRAYYSLDGGGNWLPVVAASGTMTTNLPTLSSALRFDGADDLAPFRADNLSFSFSDAEPTQQPNWALYTYDWDTFASGFFGQSDNVVFRIEAYTTLQPQQNGVAGPYQWPYAAATSFPFRVRGTQVQVYSDTIALGNELADALVYRLPANELIGAKAMGSRNKPFVTDQKGYLQGRGELKVNDQLIALYPIAATESYTLYHTSATPTLTGLDAYTVTTAGVQQLTVSADNPLILFNLDVSLEWDARNDQAYLTQLESDLKHTSQLLYDWTNGQVALGNIRVFHDKENWLDSHIIIPASNNFRPNAAMGGIVSISITDRLSNTRIIQNAYVPGQVRMSATWNRFGNASGQLGVDWPRTLAHELGHYLFYLPDNYLGLSEAEGLIQVDCRGSAMTDPYHEEYSEFLAPTEWDGECNRTLAQLTTGRTDWETITTFYDMLNDPEGDQINPGPSNLPLAVTEVTFVTPVTPTNTLPDPFFYITDEHDNPLSLPFGQALGYLFKTQGTDDLTDDVVVPVGSPIADLLQARGAEPGDRLCLFDYSHTARRLGCLDDISQGSSALSLNEVPDWEPQITVEPVTTDTLAIKVTQAISSGELYVQILPAAQPTTTVPIYSPFESMRRVSDSNTFTQVVQLNYPIANGFVRVWLRDSMPLQEEITEFFINGGWGPGGGDRVWIPTHRYGLGVSYRHGWQAPVTSNDGQATIFDLDYILGENPNNPNYILQSLSTPPNLPSWLTPVSKAYGFSSETIFNSSIMFDYLQRAVPQGQEDDLSIYYLPDDGDSWQRLPTELDTHHNLASAKMPEQGEAIYALMSTIEMPPFEQGWNLFGYPLAQKQPVTEALASIEDSYTSLYHYDMSSQLWRLHDQTVVREFSGLVNDLTDLEFGHSYYIYATEPITLYLGIPATANRQPMDVEGLELPPATFYGEVVTQSNSFTPTVGMTVTAWVGDTVCGQTKIEPWQEKLAYKLQVKNYSDCRGTNIVFKVEGEVDTWEMDGTPEWNNSQAQFHELTTRNGPTAVTLTSVTAPATNVAPNALLVSGLLLLTVAGWLLHRRRRE